MYVADAQYELTVMVDHVENLRTIYGHPSTITVTPEQKITRIDDLGLTVNAGRSSGPPLPL